MTISCDKSYKYKQFLPCSLDILILASLLEYNFSTVSASALTFKWIFLVISSRIVYERLTYTLDLLF